MKIILILLLFVICGVWFYGCSYPTKDKIAHVTKEQAIEITIKVLRKHGWEWSSNKYDMTVHDDKSEWRIFVEMKMPHPPGGHCMIYISKIDGEARYVAGR